MRRRSLLLGGVAVALVVAGIGGAVLTTSARIPEAPGGLDAPAYLTSETGAPRVERDDAPRSAERLAVDEVPLGTAARWSDGLEVTATVVDDGGVEGSGQGVVTGAAYAVLEVTVVNGTGDALDVGAVVPTLRRGGDDGVAPPLYDEVDVADLAGTLQPGATTTARYAFRVEEDRRDGSTLWLDVDAAHAPAAFTGDLRS